MNIEDRRKYRCKECRIWFRSKEKQAMFKKAGLTKYGERLMRCTFVYCGECEK